MDKEKTAMQRLIEKLKAYRDAEPDKHINGSGLNFAINEATELIEAEKKHLLDFWIEGNKQGWAQSTDHPEDAETYYTTKFNQPQ